MFWNSLNMIRIHLLYILLLEHMVGPPYASVHLS